MTRLCSLLDWDSDFFDLRIARYNRETMTAAQADRVREWCLGNRIDCLYFLADPSCGTSLSSARRLGMTAAGVRIELGAPAARIRLDPASRGIRKAKAADLDGLRSLVPSIHIASRFFVDPDFGESMGSALYAVWITRCFYDPACDLLVADQGGAIGGYCAVRARGSAGCIELLGVAPGGHGRGTGRALACAGLSALTEKGVADFSVVTQAGRDCASGFYERLGFVTGRIGLWFHYWPRLDPGR